MGDQKNMEKTKFTPLHDQVLVKPVEAGEKRYGGILIADMNEDNCRLGEVIAIGDGRWSEYGYFIRPAVEVGQTVVLPKIGPVRVVLDGEEYWVIADKQIIGILNKTKD